MPESYFDDDGDQPSKAGMDEEQPGAKPGEGGEEQGETFTINKEVCPDLKPGDSLELRVVAAHDDEYEVSYQPHEKEENEPEPEGGEGAPEAKVPDSMLD